MTVAFALNWFSLAPEWERLFERMPGWALTSPNVWTDGRTVANLSANAHGKIGFGFGTVGRPRYRRLVAAEGIRPLGNESHFVTTSPAGIAVRFQESDAKACATQPRMPLIMNHISLNVSHINEERTWYQSLLGDCTVLARESAWEPVSGKFVRDVHFFRSPWFYVTLRECRTTEVDHVGWMVDGIERVHQFGEMIAGFGWPIVYGPEEIDGCFLFHFIGPDGHVHDFFSPLAELSHRGEDHGA